MVVRTHRWHVLRRPPHTGEIGPGSSPTASRTAGRWKKVSSAVRRDRRLDQERSARAARWFSNSIGAWQRDGRISEREAETLRRKLDEPLFLAVLPHFGVHLSIGIILRFPIGSITRATYTLLNLLMATLRFALRRSDRRTWRQAMSIHSPLVIIIAGMPGIGTFAYLASKPVRTNPLLLRIGLDSALLKLPFHLYERIGLRWVIAYPRAATTSVAQTASPLRVIVRAQNIVMLLGVIAGALFAADLAVNVIESLLEPNNLIWEPVSRILDLNAEASLGTWYQVALLLVLSGLLGALAYAARSEANRFARHWALLAVLALGFSIDEAAKLHDSGIGTQLREMVSVPDLLYYTWVVPALISVILVTIYFYRFVLSLPESTRRLFIVAAGFYVGGEIGVEAIGGWYHALAGDKNFIYQTLASFEELFAMVALVIAIAAVLHTIQSTYGELRIALSPPPDRIAAQSAPTNSDLSREHALQTIDD